MWILLELAMIYSLNLYHFCRNILIILDKELLWIKFRKLILNIWKMLCYSKCLRAFHLLKNWNNLLFLLIIQNNKFKYNNSNNNLKFNNNNNNYNNNNNKAVFHLNKKIIYN